MNSIKFLLSGICMVILITSVKAQTREDYVIDTKNDTLKCALETQLFGTPKYKLPGQNSGIKITADSIKEYCFHDGEHAFISVKTAPNKKREFLPCFEKGAICLYQQAQTTTSMNPATGMSSNTVIRWYAANNPDELFLVKTNQIINWGSSKKERQKAFYNLIAKDAALLEAFKKKNDYGVDDIINAIKEYNTYILTAK